MLAEAEALAQSARAEAAPLTGTIRLGVIPTVAPYLLPAVLPALRRKYPALKLYLTEDLTERLVDGLERGRLDLLLLALPCDCGTAETLPLFDDPFQFACRADHPLADGSLRSARHVARRAAAADRGFDRARPRRRQRGAPCANSMLL